MPLNPRRAALDTFNSTVARKTHLVWNPKKPNEPVLEAQVIEEPGRFARLSLKFPVDANPVYLERTLPVTAAR